MLRWSIVDVTVTIFKKELNFCFDWSKGVYNLLCDYHANIIASSQSKKEAYVDFTDME